MSISIDVQTERLRLRTIAADDVTERYVAWLNDTRVNQYLESRFDEHTLESVASFVEQFEVDDAHVFAAILERPAERHIGNIKLGPIDSHHRRGDVGIMIGEPDAWGKGYATEAISALTVFAFRELGLERLSAGAYAVNRASVRAFERAGWEVEGRLRSHASVADGRIDCLILGCVPA